MNKAYEEPEIQIRNYAIPSSVVCIDLSNGDLEDGDDYTFPSSSGKSYVG